MIGNMKNDSYNTPVTSLYSNVWAGQENNMIVYTKCNARNSTN